MKSTQKLLLLLIIIFSFPTSSTASHLVGGEIRWECLSNGKYIFYMEIYRECTGTSFGFYTQSLQILNSTMPAIAMKPDTNLFNFYGNGNISPKSLNGTQKRCVNSFGGGSDLGAMQLFPFKSDPILLTGVPPAAGWVFYWTSSFRPNSVENLSNPASQGYGLRSIMYANAGKDAYPCYDSSPEFYELPNTSVGLGTNYSFSMAAQDLDADSLAYFFDSPLDASSSGSSFSPNPVYWKTGYTKDSPFPNQNQHPNNIAVQLDSMSGHLNGKIVYPYKPGWSYVYSIRADSYRDGIKIASVWRDAAIQVHEVDSNYKSPTFKINGSSNKNYKLTVEAGDSIHLPITFMDYNLYPDTNHPGIIRSRDIGIQYSGDMFSNNLNTENQCLGSRKPCATIFPFPVYDSSVFNDYLTRDSANLNIAFNWNTSCDILDSTNSRRNIFLFKLMDDQMPPEISYATLNVEVQRHRPEMEQLGSTLSVDAGSDSYQWFFNDTLIPNSNTNSIQMQASGKYSVEVVRNGCTSVRGSSILYAVGIGEWVPEAQLLIYPNPFNSSFTIAYSNKIVEPIELTLSNTNGKQIPIQATFQNNKIILNVISSLPSGIYFLKITTADQILYKKLIKN